MGNDGFTLFVLNLSNDTVFQYDLETAWDLSTAAYFGNSFSVTGQQTNPFGLTFKPDGTRFFIVGSTSSNVHEYTLATPWDLSTASYDSVFVSASSASGSRQGIAFTPSGETMLVTTTEVVYQVTLSTPWALTTATYDFVSYNPSEVGTTIRDIALGGNGGLGVGHDNGVTMFLISSTDDVYQYSLADYEPRDPHDYLSSPLLGVTQCGEALAQCGESGAVCDTTTIGEPDYVVNLDLTSRAPPQLPTDSQYFPYLFYVGGETFGEVANISNRRKAEFFRLLLKLRPNNQWIGLFIEYVDELLTEDDDLLTTEGGSLIFEE